MKKIIEREITNEDGDVYGVVGNITRLGAYRAIRQDLRSWGLEYDVEFKQEDLEHINYFKTIECSHDGEHEGYIWWGKPAEGDKIESLGKGWIFKNY